MGVRQLQIKVCHSLKENIWFSNQIRRSFKKKWYFIKKIRSKQLSFKKYSIAWPDKKIHQQHRTYIFTLNLKEKQKLKRYYGTISERTFRNLFKKNKVQKVFSILESRLDTILCKINFVSSPFLARQLISHGFFYVNGRRIKRKGYPLKSGDIISTSPKKKMFFLIYQEYQKIKKKKGKSLKLPSYVEVNYKFLLCVLKYIPKYNDIIYKIPFKSKLIKEFYI